MVGLLALGIGMMVANALGENDLFQLMARLFGVFMPPIAIPMLAGLLTRKTSHGGGLTGFLLGIIAGLAAYFGGGPIGSILEDPDLGTRLTEQLRWLPLMTGITVIATFLGLAIGTFLFPNSPYRVEEIDRFLSGINATDSDRRVRTSPPNVSPAPIIGVSVGALGIVVLTVILFTEPIRESIPTLGAGTALVLVGLFCWGMSFLGKNRE